MKLQWKTQPRSTGPYRSFYPRGWPMCWFNGHLVAHLESVEDEPYWPEIKEDAVLAVWVFDYRQGPQARMRRRLKARPVGVKAAKLLVQRFYLANQDWLPKD